MEVPLFPLNTVLFPGGPLPLRIFEPRYLDMVSRCMKDDMPFGVVLIREGAEVGPASTCEVGTLARIVDYCTSGVAPKVRSMPGARGTAITPAGLGLRGNSTPLRVGVGGPVPLGGTHGPRQGGNENRGDDQSSQVHTPSPFMHGIRK